MSVSSPVLSLILSLYNVLKFINSFIYSSLMIMGGKIDAENRIHFSQLKQSSMLHFFHFVAIILAYPIVTVHSLRSSRHGCKII